MFWWENFRMNYLEQNDYTLPLDFSWGDIEGDFIKWEICERRIYDRWNLVRPGNIVVDIGSSVGPFSYTAAINGAGKIYLLEPSNNLIKTSIKNLSDFIINNDNRFTFINYAVSSEDRINVGKTDGNSIVFGNNETFNTIKFSTFIEKYKIDHIDFLKIDCEGGEYDIFVEENMEFLKKRVKFIAMEVHGRGRKHAHSDFMNFRDKYLSQFANVNVITGDERLWNEHLYDNEVMLKLIDTTEIMIYIQN